MSKPGKGKFHAQISEIKCVHIIPHPVALCLVFSLMIGEIYLIGVSKGLWE